MRREPAVPPWRGANLHEDDNGNFKDGAFTAEAIEERQWLRSLALSFSGLDPEADMPEVCDGCGQPNNPRPQRKIIASIPDTSR